MNPVHLFILFQIFIIVPFIVGAISNYLRPTLSEKADSLITVNLIFLEPVIIFWSIWGLTLKGEQIYLPIAGLIIVLLGLAYGIITSPLRSLDLKSEATFRISSTLANHGFSLGGFLCYIFGGEEGLALASLFIAYFMPFLFIVVFPYARRKGHGEGQNLCAYICRPQNMPVLAIVAALLIRAAGVERPDFAMPLRELIFLDIGIYYFTLGMTFRYGDLFSNWREQTLLALEKFLIVPVIVLFITSLLPISKPVRSVIIIESFMPAAIYSVVSSILFGLNARLASTLFVGNTLLFLLLVLPLLFILHIFGVI